MIRRLALLALMALAGPWAAPVAAQDGGSISAQPPAEESPPSPTGQVGQVGQLPEPAEVTISLDAPVDYAAWGRTAARTEVIAESQRGSAFALERLRADLVTWRDRFLVEQAVNAARIGTVETQIAALGPAPAEGASEDARIATRRQALADQLARLNAPILLAQEAYAHADGLIGELDRLIRSRQTNELLSRGPTPLNPAAWPEVATGLTARAVALWKEVSVSVLSPSRLATFRGNWPVVLLYLVIGGVLLARGRRWMHDVDRTLATMDSRGRNVWRFLASIASSALPLGGVVALVAGLQASGLFGARASLIISAFAGAATFILVARWLSSQYFGMGRVNPAPFDFSDVIKSDGKRLVRRMGWLLGLSALAIAFLQTSEVTPVLRAAVYLPFEVLLAFVLFRIGVLLVRTGEVDVSTASDAMRFRRRLLSLTGQALRVIAVVVPVLSAIGYARASEALLYPAILTLALIGVVILLQWLVVDLWGWIMRAPEGARDALTPVLIGFALILMALPVLALIWGARPEDLVELWTRFREGFAMGETRISPSDFASFALVFAIGYMLTRLVQTTLRTSILPKTRLDLGAQNALVRGLGYIGIFLSAVFAITFAGIDLSNLAIVAGALSVGIGFGLQTIVSNFVSGIILLIERPISQGDWIEVGGRMGYVRDISVRSTRIETFDRTDVIVPNADLVSGQVVNWTRGNSVGRIIAPVSVMFGSDVDRVLAILREVAENHPMVLLSPPPVVILQNFGPDVLNFEIRAIVRDVNFGVQIRSELNVAIAKRFYDEGIEFAGGARANGAAGRHAKSPEPAPAEPTVVILRRESGPPVLPAPAVPAPDEPAP
jgi:potassium-dependent mechanosensitive channel